jgi:hypothetical protein
MPLAEKDNVARLDLGEFHKDRHSSYRKWHAMPFASLHTCWLAHVSGDATERAYRRGDALEKRRKLMQHWADFIETRADSNVIPMRG